MLELFKKISEEENGDLSVTYGPSYSKLITFSPFLDEQKGKKITSFQLSIAYRGQQIKIVNKLGDLHLGVLECHILGGNQLQDFRIKNRNSLKRLMSSEPSRFSILSEDQKTKDFIYEKLNSSGLEDIVKSSQFEPKISGVKSKGFEIKTEYSLVFSKKKEVIRPLIAWYKSLIDYELS